jgi:hypothetical protein
MEMSLASQISCHSQEHNIGYNLLRSVLDSIVGQVVFRHFVQLYTNSPKVLEQVYFGNATSTLTLLSRGYSPSQAFVLSYEGMSRYKEMYLTKMIIYGSLELLARKLMNVPYIGDYLVTKIKTVLFSNDNPSRERVERSEETEYGRRGWSDDISDV